MHATPTASLIAALGALAYLIGGVPVGWLLVRRRLWGLDLRHYGSGNVGTSNVFRHAGLGLAAVVGPLQFLQGLLPVLLADVLGMPAGVRVLVALCTVIGNGWPAWLGFNGGRGIAVATGAVTALAPVGLLALLPCYAVGMLRGHIAEGVLAGFILLPAIVLLAGDRGAAAGCAGLLGLVLLRRLEGVVADVHRGGPAGELLLGRLVHDRRPGRPLSGPRTDEQPQETMR